MKPYWQSSDRRTTIYHARWEDVVSAGCVPLSEVALIHGDPPYGNGEDAHRGVTEEIKRGGKGLGKQKVYAPIANNDKPFDPAPLLALKRQTVLWGANHYASRLPDSKAWLVWDKRDSFGSDNGSDCELAWCSFGGVVRQFRHLWKGLCRASESGSTAALYPTQKPIALSVFVFQHAKLKTGDLVFVPCLGSGPDVAAAHQMGLRLIGCDVSREACDLSVSRLHSVSNERAAEVVGPLFAGLH